MIGNALEKILIDLKLTPEDFAYKIGVGKSSVYKLLRGDTKKMTMKMAERISEVFPEYTIEFLISLNKNYDESPNENYFSKTNKAENPIDLIQAQLEIISLQKEKIKNLEEKLKECKESKIFNSGKIPRDS